MCNVPSSAVFGNIHESDAGSPSVFPTVYAKQAQRDQVETWLVEASDPY